MAPSKDPYGRFLRDLRRSRNLTQAQLAETTGIAQPNLSAYESGRRSPSIDVFNRIVVACGYLVVAEAGAKRLRLPLPVAGWFPDDELPSRLPDDPEGPQLARPDPIDEGARGRLVSEVLQLADAQS